MSYFTWVNSVQHAVEILRSGGLVSIPTETVYGLAAAIDTPQGIQRIFEIKERPFFDPLIVHVSNLEQARSLTTGWNSTCDLLAKHFWPGPLSLILPKTPSLNPMITASLDTVGIRMPRHPVCLELIDRLQVPLAAPSANKFGKTSPTQASHVRDEFGDSVFVLDGGPCEIGLESTVISLGEGRIDILRPGAITQAMLQNLLPHLKIEQRASVASPGHLEHHYQPSIPLFIYESGELENLLEKPSVKGPRHELVLDPNPALAARTIYSQMREFSKRGGFISVQKRPEQTDGLWLAIWDRLNRAAYKSSR